MRPAFVRRQRNGIGQRSQPDLLVAQALNLTLGDNELAIEHLHRLRAAIRVRPLLPAVFRHVALRDLARVIAMQSHEVQIVIVQAVRLRALGNLE